MCFKSNYFLGFSVFEWVPIAYALYGRSKTKLLIWYSSILQTRCSSHMTRFDPHPTPTHPLYSAISNLSSSQNTLHTSSPLISISLSIWEGLSLSSSFIMQMRYHSKATHPEKDFWSEWTVLVHSYGTSEWTSFSYDTSHSIRRKQWHPTPVLLPGKFHGRRNLLGCRPWGR